MSYESSNINNLGIDHFLIQDWPNIVGGVGDTFNGPDINTPTLSISNFTNFTLSLSPLQLTCNFSGLYMLYGQYQGSNTTLNNYLTIYTDRYTGSDSPASPDSSNSRYFLRCSMYNLGAKTAAQPIQTFNHIIPMSNGDILNFKYDGNYKTSSTNIKLLNIIIKRLS